MDRRGIRRLKEEQEKAVQDTEAQIATWQKFRSDYKCLQDRLRSLPDKVTHNVMVPFGSKAFMPGQLIHTNEILVLLGDNWFAERSAKQACEIIDRRLVGIDKQIEDLRKQRDLLKPRIGFTSELQDLAQENGDVTEIREEYDPAREKKWREQHRKNVLDHRRKQREEREKLDGADGANKQPLSDEALWARLEELERIESERQELTKESISDDDDAGDTETKVKQRSVRWADEGNSSGDKNKEHISSDEDSEEGEGTPDRPKCITFSHTKVTEESHNIKTSESSNTLEITSPADIYKLFLRDQQQPPPKSILKSTATDPAIANQSSEQVSSQDSLKAFSGSIIERDATNTAIVRTEPRHTEQDTAQNNKPTKRVSKFKADRQKSGNR